MPHETTPSLPAPNSPSGYSGVGHETNVGSELMPLARPRYPIRQGDKPEVRRLTDRSSCAGVDPPSIVGGGSEPSLHLTVQDVTLRAIDADKEGPAVHVDRDRGAHGEREAPSGSSTPSTKKRVTPLSSWISQSWPEIVPEDHQVAAVVHACVQLVADGCLLRSWRRSANQPPG